MNDTANGASSGNSEMKQRLVLFVAVFLFWCLLVWPVSPADGSLLWGDIAAGLAAAMVVAWVMRDLVTHRFARLLEPKRYFWAFIYFFVFSFYVIKATLDLVYRVWHPAMPILPGIVRVKTKLSTASARTALASSVTLTPGTLTVDITDDGQFYVHWINVLTTEQKAASEQILGRFEWFIGRIFE